MTYYTKMLLTMALVQEILLKSMMRKENTPLQGVVKAKGFREPVTQTDPEIITLLNLLIEWNMSS